MSWYQTPQDLDVMLRNIGRIHSNDTLRRWSNLSRCRTLIASIVHTLKSLVWALLLLALIAYVFAVLFMWLSCKCELSTVQFKVVNEVVEGWSSHCHV